MPDALPAPPEGGVLSFATPDGAAKVDVVYGAEAFWLTQKRMAELFGVDARTVSEHLGRSTSHCDFACSTDCAGLRKLEPERRIAQPTRCATCRPSASGQPPGLGQHEAQEQLEHLVERAAGGVHVVVQPEAGAAAAAVALTEQIADRLDVGAQAIAHLVFADVDGIELHRDMDPAGYPLDEVFELLLGFVPAETRRLTGG